MNSSNSATVVKRDGKAQANTGPLFSKVEHVGDVRLVEESEGQKYMRDVFKQNDKDIEKFNRGFAAQVQFTLLNV